MIFVFTRNMETPRLEGGRINLDAPRFDQSTFLGRAKHFFTVTDPRNILHTAKELDDAKELLLQYRYKETVLFYFVLTFNLSLFNQNLSFAHRQKKEPSGTTDAQVWKSKKVYESAFHPDTGEKMFIIGRMSAQVPMNMSICGCMLTFYKLVSVVKLFLLLRSI